MAKGNKKIIVITYEHALIFLCAARDPMRMRIKGKTVYITPDNYLSAVVVDEVHLVGVSDRGPKSSSSWYLSSGNPSSASPVLYRPRTLPSCTSATT